MNELLKLIIQGQLSQMDQINVAIGLLREIADTLKRIEEKR